jgi:anaerobic selenocysteine-containing dehydrogenase
VPPVRKAARSVRLEGTQPYVDAIAEDLQAHRGTSIVMAGEAQPPAVHVLVHQINQALGNIGATITYVPPAEIVPSDQHAALRELVSDMNAGRVQMLVLIGESNPVQTAPADLNFADAVSKVQTRFHSGMFLDETATLSHWHVPAAHYLEAWSDARTVDGTVTIVQPLIQPMFGAKSAHEVVQTLLERPERNGYDIVREHWMGQPQGARCAGAQGATGAQGAHRCAGCAGCDADRRAAAHGEPAGRRDA